MLSSVASFAKTAVYSKMNTFIYLPESDALMAVYGVVDLYALIQPAPGKFTKRKFTFVNNLPV